MATFSTKDAKRIIRGVKMFERGDFRPRGYRRRGGGGAGGSKGIRFRISSDVSGSPGHYNVKTYSGRVTSSTIGTASATENAIAICLPEVAVGATVNLLKAGGDYVGFKCGFEGGKPILAFEPFPYGKTASPTTLGVSTLAADTSTWSRTTNGTPLTLTICTRAYYDTSGEVLYHFTRALSFDACGLLISASAETRVTTDTPEDC